MASNASTAPDLSLLVTCVGRRVELLQAFRAAAKSLGIRLRILASDKSLSAPALACADVPLVSPPIAEDSYIPALLGVVQKYAVKALLPTIDTDLPILAAHRDEFSAVGCTALIGEARVVGICRDKMETFRFLREAGIDTPHTCLPEELPPPNRRVFPYFLKPRHGSASQQVHKIEDETDLNYLLRKVRAPIIQEFVEGHEHTLDVYVGLDGTPRCVVPRLRWETRTGEVSKGVVVKDLEVMDAGRRVVEALGNTVRGIVTLQCIVTPQRRIRFIEINPRFGGGAPLGIAAGADYPRWLLQELLGQRPQIAFDGFRNGVCMLRYDWSTFVPLGDDLQPALNPPLHPFPEFTE